MLGMSTEKYFTKQRIEEDHIEPLTIPFRGEVIKEFIAIDADDAWVPLSLALSKLMRRLWNLIVVGPHLWIRLDGDEYLYQILRKSLFTIFPHDDDTKACFDEIQHALPETLPSTGDLDPGSYGYINQDDACFDVIDEKLIHLAVKLSKRADTRTVDDALRLFRVRLFIIRRLFVESLSDGAESFSEQMFGCD